MFKELRKKDYICAMNEFYASESGFVNAADDDFEVMTGMTDVEILHFSKVNIIARGKRYGRRWLLKGLRPELRDSNVNRRRLQKEFEIHSRLLDPGVVQTVGFEKIGDLGLCIVEEWIEGKTLAQLLQEGELPKSERRRIMRDIIRTVGYIHSRGVIHRDLKPENVMVRDAGGGTVLIDFGLADTDDYAELKQAAGTEGYISPEQKRDGAAKVSDDIYSLGVIMKQLCPEYGKIAEKCTGPAGKRPKDAAALLKCLDDHDRRPKIMLISASSIAVLAACVILGIHFYTLSHATRQAQEKVVAITELNRLHEKHVAELTDSLSDVTDRMRMAEDEIKRVDSYNESRARAYVEGCKKIETTLKNFNTEVWPYLEDPTPEFYEKIGVLRKKLQYICDTAFDPARFPELHEDDKYKIREELQDHYISVFSAYYQEWQAKFYRDEVARKWGPNGWAPTVSANAVDTSKVGNPWRD